VPSDRPVDGHVTPWPEIEPSPDPAAPLVVVNDTNYAKAAYLPSNDAGHGSDANGASADAMRGVEAIRATFFERLPTKFDPVAASGRDFVIQYELFGDIGGKYFVEVRNGACSPSVGEHPAPTVRVSADADDWLKINSGALNRTKAFLTGRLRVKGDMALAMQLGNIFRT
jgi:putative sterol carrier protein